MPHANFAGYFGSLSDEELLVRFASGTLAEEAQVIAKAEIAKRGLVAPEPESAKTVTTEVPYAGDLADVEGNLTPQEAHIFTGFLRSAGIQASA